MRSLALSVVLCLASHASAQSIGDAVFFGFDAGSGVEAIFAGEDYAYGLPVGLLPRLSRDYDLSPDAQWRDGGNLPSPPERPQPLAGYEVPLGQNLFERDGAWLLNQNCFACHAGLIDGTVVAGLGNLEVDAATFKAMAERLIDTWDGPLRRFGLSLLLAPSEFEALGGYVDYLRTLIVPSIQATSRGDDQGPFVVWRLIARLADPARGFTFVKTYETPQRELLLETTLPTVRPNPWWRLKHKKRAFWTADVSVHSDATFALNLMDDAEGNTETFPERLRRTRAQLAFARQTEPPPYPHAAAIDPERAARGRALFHGAYGCFRCHGTYAEDGTLSEFSGRDPIDVSRLGTDATYARLLHDRFKPLYLHFARSPFAPRGDDAVHYPETIGYAPQPLVGVWAAAPFFHNGSVPTVRAVLNSRERPRAWERRAGLGAYDFPNLGIAVIEVSQRELQLMRSLAYGNDPLSESALRLRRVYDTAEAGKAATGHTFGDAMTEAEREDLLEYLRRL